MGPIERENGETMYRGTKMGRGMYVTIPIRCVGGITAAGAGAQNTLGLAAQRARRTITFR